MNTVHLLIAKWRDDAAKLRALAARAQRRGDLNDADVHFMAAQDADAYIDELEAALTHAASQPEEQFSGIEVPSSSEIVAHGLAQLGAKIAVPRSFLDRLASLKDSDLSSDADLQRLENLTDLAYLWTTERCEPCRRAGIYHCGEPDRCGNMKPLAEVP